MFKLDFGRLNEFEKTLHCSLTEASKGEGNIKIIRAAKICGCSVSKISKLAKKLGFASYKEYIGFIYGNIPSTKEPSSELMRIKDFIENFDQGIVDEFIELFERYEKIILHGYGPSFLCARYFEYKLRFATNKSVIAANDEGSLKALLDDKSLLLIFSATGKFTSFCEIYRFAKENKTEVLLIVEEYNTDLIKDYDNIIFLTRSFQSDNLSPYEKSRIVFFIFIEEVLMRLLEKGGRAARQ